jgi:fructokinase
MTKLDDPATLRATRPVIVLIGEVLWDEAADGRTLGGAPLNVALHCRRFGADARLVARIGCDDAGDAALRWMEAEGLSPRNVQRDTERPTGAATVVDSPEGPAFVIAQDVAWQRIEATPGASAAARCADAIYFGTLAQSTLNGQSAVRSLVAAAPEASWKVFDPNIRRTLGVESILLEGLRLANALKVNDGEFQLLSEMLDLRGSAEDRVTELCRRFALRCVALTSGAKGSLVWLDGVALQAGAPEVEVCDTVGAGDAFAAALCVGLLVGASLQAMSEAATRLAGEVCTRRGATPRLSPEAYPLLLHLPFGQQAV